MLQPNQLIWLTKKNPAINKPPNTQRTLELHKYDPCLGVMVTFFMHINQIVWTSMNIYENASGLFC